MVLLSSSFIAIAGDQEAATITATDIVPCKGLKPFNDVFDLLDQFYQNRDSDCLFNMPVEELEKIWDTIILTEERAKPKVYYPLSEAEFYNKPYQSEKDSFYIEKPNKWSFFIKVTKEYWEKYGTLYSQKDERLEHMKSDWSSSNSNRFRPPPLYNSYIHFDNVGAEFMIRKVR